MDFDKRDLIKKGDDFYDICQKKLVSDDYELNHSVHLRVSDGLYEVIVGLVSVEGFVDSVSHAIRSFLLLGYNIFRQKDFEYNNYRKVLASFNLDNGFDLTQGKRFKFSVDESLDMKFNFIIIDYINNAVGEDAKRFRFKSESDFKRYLICLGIIDTYSNTDIETELDVFNTRFDNFIENVDRRLGLIDSDVIKKYTEVD